MKKFGLGNARLPFIPIARRQSAYSLLEMMVALSIFASLITMAAPGFSSLIAKNELYAQSAILSNSLNLARSLAISRQRIVLVCQKLVGHESRCSNSRGFNSSWSHGWLIFVDNNGNNELDDSDAIIKNLQLESRSKIIFNQRGRLRFFPDGRARSAGFYLCDRNSKIGRHVLLLHTGRVRIKDSLTQKQFDRCKNSQF